MAYIHSIGLIPEIKIMDWISEKKKKKDPFYYFVKFHFIIFIPYLIYYTGTGSKANSYSSIIH